jgi:coenzyme F420 hydrogenase subunit beta
MKRDRFCFVRIYHLVSVECLRLTRRQKCECSHRIVCARETDTTVLQSGSLLKERQMQVRNIEEVVKSNLCTGCGTCVGVCPCMAVEMRVSKGLLLPSINLEKCSECGVCVLSCPGFSVDFEKLNADLFGKQPTDRCVGNFLRCYVGHCKDKDVSEGCSSGGVVDELLIYALEKGIIDGAVVARVKKDNPLETEPFIARTREEVLLASRSKYCPVAVGAVLKTLRKEKGRFAVVGLPCHIHGIRKAESVVNGLKEKIVLHIGLFCGHTVNFYGTHCLLEKLQARREDIVRLDYRGNGWPDTLCVELRNGRRLRLRYNRGWNAYWNIFSPFFFTPLRCLMCPDQFNELGDISLGDAWLPELKSHGRGESMIVTRTVISEELFAQTREDKRLFGTVVSIEKVKESQAFSVNFKKRHFESRIDLFRRLGQSVPQFEAQFFSTSLLGYLEGFLAYASYRFSSNERFMQLIAKVPIPLFRLYFGLFGAISMLSNTP